MRTKFRTKFSLDDKSLYSNVALKEAIDIALIHFYEHEKLPDLARNTMKKLINLAEIQVYAEGWFGSGSLSCSHTGNFVV